MNFRVLLVCMGNRARTLWQKGLRRFEYRREYQLSV